MMTAMSRFFIFLLLAFAWMPSALGQEQAGRLEQARERWERMSPAERARIAQHFNEFRGLSEAERERMKSHLNRIADARREIEASIPAELRTKLDRLESRERHQVLREYVESRMGERAERLREKMSPELVQKLDSATPAEQENLLRARREELRKRAPGAIDYLARQLALPPEEVARLKALPLEEMRRAIGDLGRRDMERRGPPPGVDPREFERWHNLPPPEFMERMHGHGQRGFRGDGERGGPPPEGQHPPRDGRDGRGGEGRRPEGRGQFGPDAPGGPPPDGPRGGPPPDGDHRDGPEGPRPPRREGRLSAEGQKAVLKSLRRESEWIVELAELPREQRNEEIDRRVRARVVENLRSAPNVTPEELARLDTLKGREFFEALRDIVGDPPRGFGDRRRRPPD